MLLLYSSVLAYTKVCASQRTLTSMKILSREFSPDMLFEEIAVCVEKVSRFEFSQICEALWKKYMYERCTACIYMILECTRAISITTCVRPLYERKEVHVAGDNDKLYLRRLRVDLVTPIPISSKQKLALIDEI